MITVNVNDTAHTLDAPLNLRDLLTHLRISEKGIAVAVNNLIISKAEWSQYQLAEGGDVLIIQATQGG